MPQVGKARLAQQTGEQSYQAKFRRNTLIASRESSACAAIESTLLSGNVSSRRVDLTMTRQETLNNKSNGMVFWKTMIPIDVTLSDAGVEG